jgi:putative intracellular protease/amidase
MSEPKTRTLGAVLYEDFELLDLYGPLEMFGSIGAGLRIVTVAEKTGPVASFQRPKTVAEFDFASVPKLDLILLPGGFGTIAQLENPAMLDFLRRRAATAEVTMSVCSGSAILSEGGAPRRTPGDVEQAILRTRTSAGRGRELDRASALGRRWAVRDFVGRLGRHGHGPGGDREALRQGDRAGDCRVDGVRVAAGLDAGSVRALPEQGGSGRGVEEDGERVGVCGPTGWDVKRP